MKNIRMLLAFLAFACVLTPGGKLYAQVPEKITNDDIIEMVRAGLGESIIIDKILTTPTEFSLSTQDLIALKEAGVNERTIRAMLQASRPSAQPPTPPTPSLAPTKPEPAASTRLERTLWQERWDSAKSKKSSGLILAITGGGVTGLGIYLTATAKESVSIFDPFSGLTIEISETNKGKRWGGIIGAVAGAGLTFWGLSRRGSGQGEMRDLEREGRAKGYLTLGPSRNGTGVLLSYNF
ncbi:hypothetical protein MYX75_02780 [Acidobacteria bacterium AH-259-A15]|nr:hypothetical protein [Acidobacteria bacterium AH-259-A15]